jgi:hypothetical protein
MRLILDGFGPIPAEQRPPVGVGETSPEELEKMVSRVLQKLLKDAKT